MIGSKSNDEERKDIVELETEETNNMIIIDGVNQPAITFEIALLLSLSQ